MDLTSLIFSSMSRLVTAKSCSRLFVLCAITLVFSIMFLRAECISFMWFSSKVWYNSILSNLLLFAADTFNMCWCSACIPNIDKKSLTRTGTTVLFLHCCQCGENYLGAVFLYLINSLSVAVVPVSQAPDQNESQTIHVVTQWLVSLITRQDLT